MMFSSVFIDGCTGLLDAVPFLYTIFPALPNWVLSIWAIILSILVNTSEFCAVVIVKLLGFSNHLSPISA